MKVKFNTTTSLHSKFTKPTLILTFFCSFIVDDPNMISESDKLLFNPCEDEINQQWVFDLLLKSKHETTDGDYSSDPSVTAQID